jgi:hypothetical protein
MVHFGAKVAVALTAFALVPAPLCAQEFKGQIKVGVHKVELQAGKIYSVVLESNCPEASFPFVESYPVNLKVFLADKPQNEIMYLVPTKSGPYTLVVASPVNSQVQQVVDYSLSVKPAPEADKPVMKHKVSITDKDPVYSYMGNKTRHKVYTIAMKADYYYVIDLVATGKEDPYLYLENADKKVVDQDDDSGGELNARIMYRPLKDGDYRIIATTLDNATGDMHLSVHMLPTKKKK